jgi:peptidoglycan hydrolase CwlO-like protein
MTKFMQEDRAKIDRLNNVIDMKQREIDEINKTNTDLLWKLAVLEKKNGKLQEYRDNNEAQIAYYEKKLNKFKFDIDNEKDN